MSDLEIWWNGTRSGFNGGLLGVPYVPPKPAAPKAPPPRADYLGPVRQLKQEQILHAVTRSWQSVDEVKQAAGWNGHRDTVRRILHQLVGSGEVEFRPAEKQTGRSGMAPALYRKGER